MPKMLLCWCVNRQQHKLEFMVHYSCIWDTVCDLLLCHGPMSTLWNICGNVLHVVIISVSGPDNNIYVSLWLHSSIQYVNVLDWNGTIFLHYFDDALQFIVLSIDSSRYSSNAIPLNIIDIAECLRYFQSYD